MGRSQEDRLQDGKKTKPLHDALMGEADKKVDSLPHQTQFVIRGPLINTEGRGVAGAPEVLGRWFRSGARNHQQANRSLGFCFEIPVSPVD
jgi:hypothetical protein